MAKLNVPAGVVAIVVGDRQFDAADGAIDITDVPAATVAVLEREYGCILLDDAAEQDDVADAAKIADERKAIIDQLTAGGVSVDGRIGITRLRTMLVAMLDQQNAGAAVAAAGAGGST